MVSSKLFSPPAEIRANKTWFREFFTLPISKERIGKFLLKAFFQINLNSFENATVYHWYKHRHINQQGGGARDPLLARESVKMHCDKQVTEGRYFNHLL